MKSELRPHQAKAMDLLRRSLGSGKRRPMIQAPTGFGKTLLGASIVDGALAKGNKVTFCVPALSLIDQTVQAFWDEGIRDVGVIQASHELTNAERAVQIASVQTLERRVFPETNVIVIDEAHRWFKVYERWMNDPLFENVPFVGLSATPWTKGLGKFFDDLLIASTTKDLIDAGYLSDFQVYGPSTPDLSGVRTLAGDWHEGDLGTAMDKPKLVADVVSTWCRLGEDRPTLVFAVNRAHAKHLRDEFEASGVSAGYIDAYTDADERDSIRRSFHSGEIKVVCNVGCLTTGVDWDVRCIVLARPTKSEMLFVQMVGRGLRTAEGKQDCLILDHSDTHQRLGFVTEILHENLDDGRPKTSSNSKNVEKKEKLPTVCPSCSFMKPVGMHACPSCGFLPEKKSDVEAEEGELVAMKGGKKQKYTAEDKTRWYSELLGYCHEKGKSRGYADGKFKDKFGHWPATKWGISPVKPSPEVLSFIRSRNIAWAKSRRKKENAA